MIQFKLTIITKTELERKRMLKGKNVWNDSWAFLTLGNGVSVGMVGCSITTLPDPDPLISCCWQKNNQYNEYNHHFNDSDLSNYIVTNKQNTWEKLSKFYVCECRSIPLCVCVSNRNSEEEQRLNKNDGMHNAKLIMTFEFDFHIRLRYWGHV